MVPTLDFHGQPFRDEDAAGVFLRRALGDESITSVSVAVAWARFGGLARIEDAVEEFRRRGGTAEAIVGIDEGGATRPGLRKAVAMFSKVLVLHDPSGRTFHPKLYLAEGPTKALLLVGSSNATAGGLFFNYEASVEAEFRLPDEEGDPALRKTRRYFELLREDAEICLEVTEGVINELIDDPRYPISETERRKKRRRPTEPPEGAEEDETDALAGEDGGEGLSAPIFGRSRHAKPGVPSLAAQARRELAELEAEADHPIDEVEAEQQSETPQAATAVAPGRTPRVVASWSKRLSHADAQQPTRPGTNPIGNLRLTKAGHDIDHRTWFREELLRSAAWVSGQDSHGNPIEEATLPMDVTVGGVSLGTEDLRVSHAEHREAAQRNVLTVLHWGSTLGPLLRGTDYTGHTVTIQHLDDDSFRLRIEP